MRKSLSGKARFGQAGATHRGIEVLEEKIAPCGQQYTNPCDFGGGGGGSASSGCDTTSQPPPSSSGGGCNTSAPPPSASGGGCPTSAAPPVASPPPPATESSPPASSSPPTSSAPPAQQPPQASAPPATQSPPASAEPTPTATPSQPSQPASTPTSAAPPADSGSSQAPAPGHYTYGNTPASGSGGGASAPSWHLNPRLDANHLGHNISTPDSATPGGNTGGYHQSDSGGTYRAQPAPSQVDQRSLGQNLLSNLSRLRRG